MRYFLVLSAQNVNDNTSLVMGLPLTMAEYNAELFSQVCDRLSQVIQFT